MLNGRKSLGKVLQMLKWWKFCADDIEEVKVLKISFTCRIIKVESAVPSDGRLPNYLRAVASGFY
jgi:hypothetical protein